MPNLLQEVSRQEVESLVSDELNSSDDGVLEGLSIDEPIATANGPTADGENADASAAANDTPLDTVRLLRVISSGSAKAFGTAHS